MKAKNEVAEKFQAKVADEIIPSIRKTGGYVLQGLSKEMKMCIRDRGRKDDLFKRSFGVYPSRRAGDHH